ncbi:MAG: hypothetical protein IKE52_07420 [Mogibacterium sp.]|nr:hypothetical protein [Mogibacterium sp.]
MMRDKIITIENASLDYKEYARRLSALLEQFYDVFENSEGEFEEIGTVLSEIEEQIQEMKYMAIALEEAANNYRGLYKSIDENEAIFRGEKDYIEFGISEFSNLSEHEHLIPVH